MPQSAHRLQVHGIAVVSLVWNITASPNELTSLNARIVVSKGYLTFESACIELNLLKEDEMNRQVISDRNAFSLKTVPATLVC